MNLGFQTIQSLVAGAAAAIQGACAQLLDLAVGSPLRAILEANAAQISWQQANILDVARAMRLATATGADVDSFVEDFDVFREPPVPAVGQATFGRYSPVAAAAVLVGSTCRTGDASQTFAVVADSANPAWSATVGTSGGYVLPSGVESVTVPVAAVAAGAAGNVGAGAVQLLGDATVGIDWVTNAAPFTGGLDWETDAALKARFRLHIASLERATLTAVESAVADVQQGLTWLVRDNVDEAGNFRPGHFVVFLDDGSGTPSDALKDKVYKAVARVRALTVGFSVMSPRVVPAPISLSLQVDASGDKQALVGPVQRRIAAYVNSLAVGAPLSLTRVAALAFAVDPSIVNVTSVGINGKAADLDPGPTGVVKVAFVAVG